MRGRAKGGFQCSGMLVHLSLRCNVPSLCLRIVLGWHGDFRLLQCNFSSCVCMISFLALAEQRLCCMRRVRAASVATSPAAVQQQQALTTMRVKSASLAARIEAWSKVQSSLWPVRRAAQRWNASASSHITGLTRVHSLCCMSVVMC